MKISALTLLPIASVLLGLTADADLIVGQVVDSNGVGVAGVDIDAKDLGGGDDPPLSNDGTDTNGFFATTIPAGTFRLTFIPPPPPDSTSLIMEIDDVVVSGTTDLGVVVLPPGVAVVGRAVDGAGQPVAGVNLDVIDPSGNNIDLPNDNTDAMGNFAIAAPLGAIEVRFDTTPFQGPRLAPRFFELEATVDIDLGDVVFEPGYLVSALVLGPGGGGVSQADVDTVDVQTDRKLYTPGDNTDNVGFVDFVVPAGDFNFEICPPPGVQIAPLLVGPVTVGGDTSLGILNMQAGVTLSGVIRSHLGLPVAGVDVDLDDAFTGDSVLLCRDRSDASGAYVVIVAPGTYDVCFSPRFDVPLGLDVHPAVIVAGATLLDGNLPACPFYTNIGGGIPGTGGVIPALAATSAPRLGNPAYAFEVSGGLGGSAAFVAVAFDREPVPTLPLTRGGLVAIYDYTAEYDRTLPLVLTGPAGSAGAGTGTVSIEIPNDPLLLPGVLRARAYVRDGSGRLGFVASDGLAATLCE